MIGMVRAADGQVPERAPAYLRVPEAAQVMNMSVRGVYREIESGRLRKTLKRGTTGPIYVALSEIERWGREEFVEVAQ